MSDTIDNTSTVPADTQKPITDYTVIVERLTGTVKWFNNKAGFGFITVCEQGEYYEKDIFVHYSSIRVSNSQYKYLVQGEYVDFTLVKANSDTHEFQAMDVSGVKGGPIMCETRRSNVGAGGPVNPAVNVRRDSAAPRARRPDTRRPKSATAADGVPSSVAPTATMSGEDMLGFTKVERKRKPRAPTKAPPAIAV